MMYLDKDMERVMQKKKRDIINELEAYKNKILREMSGVDKLTLTRLRQIINDYNKIEIELEKYGDDLAPLVRETKELREELKEEIETIDKMNNFITAEAYGAVGDGVADDTAALQCAIAECSDEKIPLYIPKGKIYRITNPLNFINGEYKDVKVCIDGFNPINSSVYVNENYGGLLLEEGVSLFKNAKITGSINRVAIIGVRESTKIFDTCEVTAFTLSNSLLANHGAVFYNSGTSFVSRITHNIMLSCAFFAQIEDYEAMCTDTLIECNYINGGQESTDNACFEWNYFNGSNVSNNFIDYYKVMYRPKSTKSTFSYLGPTSTGNQYQVFRYFYDFSRAGSSKFLSVGDTFNWTNENSANIKAVMDKWTKDTYTGNDGITYEVPNYIARPYEAGMINISDAKIEDNIGNVMYIAGTPTNFEYSSFKFNLAGCNKFINPIARQQGRADGCVYNLGNYMFNYWDVDVIEKVTVLPTFKLGWCEAFHGQKVLCDNVIYKAVNTYDATTQTWTAKWLDNTGKEA